MKKKLMVFVFMFIMLSSSIFCGCDLVSDNLSKRLNTPVAVLTYKDKSKVNITVKEFNIAMNNYGLDLMQNNNYDYKTAAEETLKALINRKVMLIEAKRQFDLTEKDKKHLWKDTYDALVSNLESFEDDVRKDWELTLDKTTEDKKDEPVVYKEYEKKAYVTTEKGADGKNNIVIKIINDRKNDINVTNTDKSTLKQYVFDEVNNSGSKIKKEALKRYLKQLKKNEEGQRLSTDNDSVFNREVERIYQNLEETIYITKLQNFYQYGSTEGVEGDYTSVISVQDILNKYKAMMLASKTLYEANKTKYDSDMTDSFSSVNYVVDDKYFFVSHILLKFNDEQQKVYDNLESQLKKGEITPLEYKEKLDTLYNEIQGIVRDNDGNIIENETISAKNLLNQIKNDLNNVNDYESKAEIFKNYLYKHNQDDGINNAEYMYIVGTENSKMVESFTEASRQLNENGKLGAISDIVKSNYGVHIIFYGGKVENLFTIPENGSLTLNDEDIWKLCDRKLNEMSNKTLFDLVFEKVTKDNYSSFESMQIRLLKEDINIVKYPNRYKQK